MSISVNRKNCDQSIGSKLLGFLVLLLTLFLLVGNGFALAFPYQESAIKPSTSENELEQALISVSGLIVDESNQPIPGAIVYLREWAVLRDIEIGSYGSSFNRKRKYNFAKTKTDQSGKFNFSDVKSPPFDTRFEYESRWTVVAEVPGRSNAWFKLTQPKSDKPIRLIAAKGATVQGVVRTSKGQPISGVDVYVDEISRPSSRQAQVLPSVDQFIYRNSELSPRATTDTNGKFSIQNVTTESRVGVAFVHEKYVSQIDYFGTTKQPQSALKVNKPRRGKFVVISYPIQVGEMQVKLIEGHRLMGQLVDEKGVGVADQDFELLTSTGGTERLVTNAKGGFKSRRFQHRDLRLRMRRPNSERFVAWEKDVRFNANETEKQIVIQMPVPKTIRGVLKSEDSKPIPQATIVFVPEIEPSFGLLKRKTTTKTDKSGNFEMRISAESGFIISVGPVFGYELSKMETVDKFQRGELSSLPKSWERIKASSFSKPSGQDSSKVAHVDLQVLRSRVVSGQVLNESGDPVRNASIDVADGLFEWSGPFPRMNREQIRKLFSTRSDDKGNFQVSGIPRLPNVVLSVVDPGKSEVALIYLDQLATYSDVDVNLKKGVEISGRIKLDGKPISNVTVFLDVIGEYKKIENGKSLQEQFHWGQVKSDANGTYRFTGVPSKPQYFVTARLGGNLDASRNPKLDKSNLNIRVTDFDFKSRNAAISGIVVDPSGAPVPDVAVSARDENSDQQDQTDITGADGSFLIKKLPDKTEITLKAYLKSKRSGFAAGIHTRAVIQVTSGDRNIRLVLDPRLAKEPRKIHHSNSKKLP